MTSYTVYHVYLRSQVIGREYTVPKIVYYLTIDHLPGGNTMAWSKRKVTVCLLIAALVLSLAGCMNTSYDQGLNVTEADNLKVLITEPDVLVIDARSPEDYGKGHLQGAVNLPPSELTVGTPVPGMIAPKAQVEKILGQNGISNTTKLYIYDNNGSVNASRLWWVLKTYGHEKAFVINNGETAVVASGLPLTAEASSITPTLYTAKEMDSQMIASLEEVKAITEGTSQAKLVDVRTQVEFDEGAIPNAILYPHTKNLYKDGTFRSAQDIYLNYKDLGLNREDEIVLYCKTSFRATMTALLLNEAGFTNVKVYDGAWSEWSETGLPQAGKPAGVAAPTVQDAS